MAITYPVDSNSWWSVLQVSTGNIIKRNQRWPIADGTPIPGLDPDFVYLRQVDTAQPNYDSRLYQLVKDETIDVDNNTITSSWSTISRDLAERIIAAENKEVEELSKHIVPEKEMVETRLMVTAILNYIEGLQLPPKVQDAADRYQAKGTKLWKNRDRVKAIIAELEADGDPDLDSGWEEPDAE